jgi:hypothetical protein
MSGQSTVFLILLVIMLFAGTAVMLLTFAKTINQSDYINMYTHNLLLSILRSDTGYSDPNCKLVSDAIICAFFSPNAVCRGGTTTCLEVAKSAITDYVGRFSSVKKSYRYLLTVQPSGFTMIDENTGEPFTISVGDSSISSVRNQTKYTANEQLRKAATTGVFNIDVKLTVVPK